MLDKMIILWYLFTFPFLDGLSRVAASKTANKCGFFLETVTRESPPPEWVQERAKF